VTLAVTLPVTPDDALAIERAVDFALGRPCEACGGGAAPCNRSAPHDFWELTEILRRAQRPRVTALRLTHEQRLALERLPLPARISDQLRAPQP
jgi:hypothetical protein